MLCTVWGFRTLICKAKLLEEYIAVMKEIRATSDDPENLNIDELTYREGKERDYNYVKARDHMLNRISVFKDWQINDKGDYESFSLSGIRDLHGNER